VSMAKGDVNNAQGCLRYYGHRPANLSALSPQRLRFVPAPPFLCYCSCLLHLNWLQPLPVLRCSSQEINETCGTSTCFGIKRRSENYD
jgi:hypothetical protein